MKLYLLTAVLLSTLMISACNKVHQNELDKLIDGSFTKLKASSQDVEIFVSDDSIEESVGNGIKVRKATVIYRFTVPIAVRSVKVSYMRSESFFDCQDRLFINDSITFYDRDAHPVAKAPRTMAEAVDAGSNVGSELEYVCDFNTHLSQQNFTESPPDRTGI